MSASRRWPVAALLGLAALTGLGVEMANAASNGARPPERIYASNCGYCHGHNVGPIIRGRKLAPQLVEYMVRNGNGAMPAFKPTEITPAELATLAEWVSRSTDDPQEHGR